MFRFTDSFRSIVARLSGSEMRTPLLVQERADIARRTRVLASEEGKNLRSLSAKRSRVSSIASAPSYTIGHLLRSAKLTATQLYSHALTLSDVFCVGADVNVATFEPVSGLVTRELRPSTGCIFTCHAFSRDGSFLVTGESSGSLR